VKYISGRKKGRKI